MPYLFIWEGLALLFLTFHAAAGPTCFDQSPVDITPIPILFPNDVGSGANLIRASDSTTGGTNYDAWRQVTDPLNDPELLLASEGDGCPGSSSQVQFPNRRRSRVKRACKDCCKKPTSTDSTGTGQNNDEQDMNRQPAQKPEQDPSKPPVPQPAANTRMCRHETKNTPVCSDGETAVELPPSSGEYSLPRCYPRT